jgi:hypothetical protein
MSKMGFAKPSLITIRSVAPCVDASVETGLLGRHATLIPRSVMSASKP